MNILIASATAAEVQPTLDFLYNHGQIIDGYVFEYKNHIITILITGPGSMHLLLKLSNLMMIQKFDLYINAGIAGSFDRNVKIGQVVKISRDRFADLGAELKDGQFVDVFELGLSMPPDLPYEDGWIKDDSDPQYFNHLSYVQAITVNKVSGTAASIEKMIEKYHPIIETMEGAGFMLASKQWGLKGTQIRSISNDVEPRDKSRWDIPVAIHSLNNELINFLKNVV
ncbi:MAG: futalosine hydrolase [Saprospiraceae bacterium]